MPVATNYKWAVVAMLWFVCLFNYADRQAIFSVFPLLKAEMKLTDVELSVVGSSFMWIYAIAGPLAGLLADRFSRKTLILGGLIFWSVVTFATAYAPSYLVLVILRGLQGLGEAFFFPATMSLISDYHGKDTRSRAMAINQSGVYAGTIFGASLAGLLGQWYGWRFSFLVFGGLGIVLGLALWALLKEPERGRMDEAVAEPEARQPLLQSITSAFAHPMARTLAAIFLGANFVAVIFLTWMPSFLFTKFHMSLSMAGLNGTAYLQIASVCGVMLGGYLADRFAKRHPAGRMYTQALGLFIGIPFIFLTGWTLSIPTLVVAMAGFGFGKGLYDANIWASLYDVVKPAQRGTALGFMNSLAWLGGSLGPVAVAAAAGTWGMSAAISASSLVYLAIALLLVGAISLFMNRGRSGSDPAAPAAA